MSVPRSLDAEQPRAGPVIFYYALDLVSSTARGPTPRSDCPFPTRQDSMPHAAGPVGAPAPGLRPLRLLRQRGIRSATRVPRIGCERFRADTLEEAPDTRRTAHFPVHPCTVFSAPLLDPPSGRSQRCSHPTCERCARRALSSSRRRDAGHVGRPALGRAYPAERRRSSPSGPAPLHKKQCSRSNGRTKPPSRPRWKRARRTVAFGPRRRRAGRLALFLPSPCRAIRRDSWPHVSHSTRGG